MNGTIAGQQNKTPRVGMLAKVRNRRGVIASVEPYDGTAEGRLHLVRIEYTDADGILEDTILWEREESTDLLEPHSLPRVDAEPRMDRVRCSRASDALGGAETLPRSRWLRQEVRIQRFISLLRSRSG
jgi:hypothetical protein